MKPVMNTTNLNRTLTSILDTTRLFSLSCSNSDLFSDIWGYCGISRFTDGEFRNVRYLDTAG